MNKVAVAKWDDLAIASRNTRLSAKSIWLSCALMTTVSVFYGRCLHRGALMSDGHVDDNDNLICGVHNWDYRLDSGVSEYENSEALPKFQAWIENGDVLVDADEIKAWGHANPQPYQRDEYLGLYQDPSHAPHPEPTNGDDPAICPRWPEQSRASRHYC